jgi:hypothetical protein
LVQKVSKVGKALAAGKGNINVAVSSFIPKALTPFQWEPMAPRSYLEECHSLLRRMLPKGRVRLRLHNLDMSVLEAVFARGDRRLGEVVLEAASLGCRLDAWGEHFRPDLWRQAFTRRGIDPDFYALRKRPLDEVLPWCRIRAGIATENLKKEYQSALRVAEIPREANWCGGSG